MRKSIGYVFCALAAGLYGCGWTQPYQVAPSAIANEGVRITLAGQRCYVNRTAEQYPTEIDDDRLHVDVQLSIQNEGGRSAVVSLDNFRLADDQARATLLPLESGAFSLPPGESKAVAVGFEERAAPGCRHSLALLAGGAVSVDGRPLEFNPMRFQPKR